MRLHRLRDDKFTVIPPEFAEIQPRYDPLTVVSRRLLDALKGGMHIRPTASAFSRWRGLSEIFPQICLPYQSFFCIYI